MKKLCVIFLVFFLIACGKKETLAIETPFQDAFEYILSEKQVASEENFFKLCAYGTYNLDSRLLITRPAAGHPSPCRFFVASPEFHRQEAFVRGFQNTLLHQAYLRRFAKCGL